jgi:type II secretory ATPase GspE/PulE/Tfp pilus assembly ATPase PilB-like protein
MGHQRQLCESGALQIMTATHQPLAVTDLSTLTIHEKSLVHISKMRQHRFVFLNDEDLLDAVAMSEPRNPHALKTIRHLIEKPLRVYRVDDQQLEKTLTTYQRKRYESKLASDENNDTILQKFLDLILAQAIDQQASDIHFEPQQTQYRIRLRIDGLLLEAGNIHTQHAARITNQLKTLANLDIAESRLPQDGRCRLTINNNPFDARISTCPTIYGEKTVLRLLKTTHRALGIHQLGLSLTQKRCVCTAIQKPQGLILVTGPTGSGKTITLYSALQHINHLQKNITTIEDPVEIPLPGINQINIKPRIHFTFANVLRALLRQDPDIIMIGEIRDKETAEIAIKAAQTGHLVLTTLHTNNAISAITRLQQIGIPAHDISAALTLVIAQRLIRKTCQHCHGSRCLHCQQGYQGRTGVFEVLPISAPLASLIATAQPTAILLKQAKKEGFMTLKEIAGKLFNNTVTTSHEIFRVLD